jgi:hypothetical protein
MSKEIREHIDKFNKFRLTEIYSDKDMERGEELGKNSFGLDMKFKGDFRRDKLIIKKLVRLKSKITDEQLKSEIDTILDMLEGTDVMNEHFSKKILFGKTIKEIWDDIYSEINPVLKWRKMEKYHQKLKDDVKKGEKELEEKKKIVQDLENKLKERKNEKK